MKAHALVLAAGLGRRFAGRKLLAPLRGRPILAHVLDAVVEAIGAGVLGGGVAVVAEGDTAVERLVREAGQRVIHNPSPETGLADSVRLGLAALAELSVEEARAAVVFLGDQPAVRASTVTAVVSAWQSGRGPAVRPRYLAHPDEPGHPTLLDRALWSLADGFTGDTGFAPLLAGSADVAVIDVPGENPDVDTPSDLRSLEEAAP